MVAQGDIAALGRRLAQQQGRARGGIDLAVMVHFEDFHVVIGQHGGGLAHQARQHIDAQREIA